MKCRSLNTKIEKMEEIRVEMIALESLVKEKAYGYELDILRDRMECEFTRLTKFDELSEIVATKADNLELVDFISKSEA